LCPGSLGSRPLDLSCTGKNAKKTTMTTRKRLKKMGNIMGKKVHYKQKAFHGDKSRNRWIFGGNRTGKTWAGAFEAVSRAIKKPCEGWVVSLSTQVQRDVAQRKVLELLKAKGIDYECVMLSGKVKFAERGVIDFITIGKSRIGFKNCEQGREKFQGTSLDWVWFDEEPPEEIYEECLIRTLDKKGDVWGTMTPLKGRTWVYNRIFMNAGQDGISVHQWEWSDNPFLDKDEIALMERNYSTDTLESRKFGRFMEGLGMVFTEFGEENIEKNVSVSSKLQTFVYTGISIDPGYQNPTAVLWFGIDGDGSIFVIDEFKESNHSVEQIAEMINQKSKEIGVPVRNVFIDSAATAQTFGAPESVASQFRAYGIDVDPRVDKNVFEGIHRVKGLFRSNSGVRKLFVFAHCVRLIQELRGYFWGDNNRPVKKDDHCLDALRYFCMASAEDTKHEPQSPVAKSKPTIFDKHKRSLFNENN